MTTYEADPTVVPERYRSAVVAHIMVSDADAAIAFYRQAFGAVEEFRLALPDGRVPHAEIRIAGSVLMLGDTSEGPFAAPAELNGTSVALHLFVPDVDALVDRAVAAGAQVVREPADQFHGDRNAILRDPFGHLWVFLTHLEDLSEEELVRSFHEATAQQSPAA
ncbi:VOC family protein [Streptomyces sp. NPDC029003]|uniref:VOC family protein n=1 Tax=Streptomyces sp. NPDC029003 TaxID=3155125 RepID=UPI003406D661